MALIRARRGVPSSDRAICGTVHVCQCPEATRAVARTFRLASRDDSHEVRVSNIAVDIVDAYVFRHHNGMVQFLLLQRAKDVSMGGTWHGVHGKIDQGLSALETAKRSVYTATSLIVVAAYSADYTNQFFDPVSDSIILAPVFAFTVDRSSRITLSDEFSDYAWCETEEATSRLLFSGQRWAIRHIEEIIGMGGGDAEYYRVQ